MNPDDPIPKKTRRWGCMLFLLIPVILFGGGVLWLVMRNRQAQAELEDRREAMAVEGLPYDDATLEVYYREGGNDLRAAQWTTVLKALDNPDFSKASEAIPILGFSDDDIPPVGEDWPAQASVQSFMDKYDTIRDQLIELASHDDAVRFEMEFDGYMTLLTHVQAMRQCSRFLSVEANLARHAGDAEREYRAVNGLYGCALAIRGEPTLIAHLVGIALHGIATSELRNSIEAGTLSDEHLEKLAARLCLFDDFRTPTYRSIRGEIAFGLSAFESPDLEVLGGPPLTSIPGFAAQDSLNYLDLMERMSDLLSKPDLTLGEFLKGSEEWQASFESTLENANWLQQLESIRTSLVTPAVEAYSRAVIRHASENRIAKLAVALRRYEAKYGALPETLADLNEFGVDVTAELLPNGEQFGYRKFSPSAERKAVIWGYDMVSKLSSGAADVSDADPGQVSAEPPASDAIDPKGYKGWYWELR